MGKSCIFGFFGNIFLDTGVIFKLYFIIYIMDKLGNSVQNSMGSQEFKSKKFFYGDIL